MPNFFAYSSRLSLISTAIILLAPVTALRRLICRRPESPLPKTITASAGFIPASLCPRTTHASGSINVPSSKLTESGKRYMPLFTFISGSLINSENPPGSKFVVLIVSQAV